MSGCLRTPLALTSLTDEPYLLPLAWYPRLLHATPQQRMNWKIAGAGYCIHWPELDEDLSTQGLLQAASASRVAKKVAA